MLQTACGEFHRVFNSSAVGDKGELIVDFEIKRSKVRTRANRPKHFGNFDDYGAFKRHGRRQFSGEGLNTGESFDVVSQEPATFMYFPSRTYGIL